MRTKRYNLIGKGLECPKCNEPMERREHLENDKRILKKVYYYTEWDYCKTCQHVQHYDHFKVWNNNKKAKKLRPYLNLKNQDEQQQNFLKSIN